MSGAVAAHAAYNGSGTQGLAVTNKVSGADGDVQSVFWNANNTTRQLVYGSAFVEIPANSGSGNNKANTVITQVFDVNNDIDCLGDMVLKVSLTHGGTLGTDDEITAHALALLIDRVEVQVGTQIWQTLEGKDLLALNSTEMSSGAFADFSLQASGGLGGEGAIIDASVLAGGGGTGLLTFKGFEKEKVAFFPLKTFTKTIGPNLENFAEHTESGYLMAAAPHQQVKVKVVTKPPATANTTITTGVFTDAIDGFTVTLSLFAKSQVMCNEEREAMKSMPQGIPKRIKMTQHATKEVGASTKSVEFDLDHFSLYASHILISVPLATDQAGEMVSPTAELLLNSSSFSGRLPLGLLRMTGSSMGLYTNSFRLNGLDDSDFTVYVFPLASRAYGGSSVPLNRFDNIRLRLTDPTAVPEGKIDITCVGETTALYKNGAASLAMY